MKKYLFVLLFCTACWHPASYHRGEVQDPSEKLTVGTVQKEIYKGMDAGDVAASLGSPNIVTRDEQGRETWIYDKISSEAAYSKSSTGLPGLILGFSESGARSSSDRTLTVVIKFDENSKVRAFSYNSTRF